MMDYQQAQKIRGKTFASMMTEKLAEGGGIGGSLRATVSERSQARMKGIKEKFDILNIAKMMTGGSNLAPAILGRLLGRNTRDIKYFSGIKDKKTASKLGPVDNSGTSPEMMSMLEKIYNFLKETIDEDRLKKSQESQFAEERQLERLRRHKELMEAITGKPYKKTYAKVTDTEKKSGGILSDILGGFSDVKDLLKAASTFFSSPIGAVMLAGAAAGLVGFAFVRFLTDVREQDKLQRPQDYENVPYDVSKQTGETMGEVGQRQKGQAVKQVTPQYAKDLLNAKPAFTDAELVENTGLTRTELEEELKKNPGKNIMVPIAPKAKPVEPAEQSNPSPVQQNTSTPVPATTASPPPVQTENVGQRLNALQGENLMAKIDDKTAVAKAVTTNNVIKNSLNSSAKRGYIPSVRNQEETFQQMILYSTRVV